jgi:hypothetical protein
MKRALRFFAALRNRKRFSRTLMVFMLEPWPERKAIDYLTHDSLTLVIMSHVLASTRRRAMQHRNYLKVESNL